MNRVRRRNLLTLTREIGNIAIQDEPSELSGPPPFGIPDGLPGKGDTKKIKLRFKKRLRAIQETGRRIANRFFLRLLRRGRNADALNIRSYLRRASINAALDVIRSRQGGSDSSAARRFFWGPADRGRARSRRVRLAAGSCACPGPLSRVLRNICLRFPRGLSNLQIAETPRHFTVLCGYRPSHAACNYARSFVPTLGTNHERQEIRPATL